MQFLSVSLCRFYCVLTLFSLSFLISVYMTLFLNILYLNYSKMFAYLSLFFPQFPPIKTLFSTELTFFFYIILSNFPVVTFGFVSIIAYFYTCYLAFCSKFFYYVEQLFSYMCYCQLVIGRSISGSGSGTMVQLERTITGITVRNNTIINIYPIAGKQWWP